MWRKIKGLSGQRNCVLASRIPRRLLTYRVIWVRSSCNSTGQLEYEAGARHRVWAAGGLRLQTLRAHVIVEGQWEILDLPGELWGPHDRKRRWNLPLALLARNIQMERWWDWSKNSLLTTAIHEAGEYGGRRDGSNFPSYMRAWAW